MTEEPDIAGQASAGQAVKTNVELDLHTQRSVGSARTAARASQFIDFAFYVIYALLAIRLVLALIAARSSNGFVQLIATVSDPFYAPFKGIVASPTVEGGHTLVVPIMIAILVYAIVHVGVNAILRMVGTRKTAV